MKIHQYAIMCASNMSQEAAIEALENCQKEVEVMRNDYERRRNFVVNRLNEIGLPCHTPKGAFYAFPSITSTGLKSTDFSLQLLKSQKSRGCSRQRFRGLRRRLCALLLRDRNRQT